MGRGEPKYDLHELQRLIGQGPVSSTVTLTAEAGATELSFALEAITEAVLELSPRHFYKSMESEMVPGLWQDVYHMEFRGKWLYIKLQLGPDGRAVVIQFKRK
ncbi:type II toxin-antitoxin system MqsR family toxin [Longimicrobium sp.]|uniref:type II toxin-antitoxin system MqsR family toxin n=1 Tax=Longimicrobium sp. TaxID=2029185 RepID=UPI003B3B369C